MNRGIYIVANDAVIDSAIALLSSLRFYDPQLPVVLIPFDQHYHQVWQLLSEHYQVQLFPDLQFLEDLTETIARIFPVNFLKRPHKLRKLAAWFGPLDEFLYIDTDIIVFRSLTETLDYLTESDFVSCDFQFRGRGLADVFSATVLEAAIFTPAEVQDTFNSGFWGSRRQALSFEQMTTLLQDCANHPEYFDFSSGTTDQPILNYIVLKSMPRRLNLTQINPDEPGNWAGSSHFIERHHRLYDGHRPLRYLHWAGVSMGTDGPYRQLWEYYRFRTVDLPLQAAASPPQPRSFRQWLRWSFHNLVQFFYSAHN